MSSQSELVAIYHSEVPQYLHAYIAYRGLTPVNPGKYSTEIPINEIKGDWSEFLGNKKSKKAADSSDSDSSSSDSDSSDSDSDSDSDSSDEELTEEQIEKKRKYDEKIARNIEKEQSNVIFDVMPEDSDIDLDGLVNKMREITMDGLLWAVGHEVIPIAFGLKKIRIATTIFNVKVSTEELQDAIDAIEGVGSSQIIAFQKI